MIVHPRPVAFLSGNLIHKCSNFHLCTNATDLESEHCPGILQLLLFPCVCESCAMNDVGGAIEWGFDTLSSVLVMQRMVPIDIMQWIEICRSVTAGLKEIYYENGLS